jgi:hypothetical protein
MRGGNQTDFTAENAENAEKKDKRGINRAADFSASIGYSASFVSVFFLCVLCVLRGEIFLVGVLIPSRILTGQKRKLRLVFTSKSYGFGPVSGVPTPMPRTARRRKK